MNTTRKEKSVPTVPDKNYSLKQIEAIIQRNDDQFALKLLMRAANLEKTIRDKTNHT